MTCPSRFPLEQRAQDGLFTFGDMSKKRYNKPALTYPQLIQQLKDRGLTIQNEDKVLNLLKNISYYGLSGYWYPF